MTSAKYDISITIIAANDGNIGKLYETNSDISFNLGELYTLFLSQVISFVKFFLFIMYAGASPSLSLCDNPVEL